MCPWGGLITCIVSFTLNGDSVGDAAGAFVAGRNKGENKGGGDTYSSSGVWHMEERKECA